MSNTYAEFYSFKKDGFPQQSRNMGVTAFVGDGRAIQLTLSEDHDGHGYHTYITLNEKQVNDLIKVLQARIDGTVTATGYEHLGHFWPDRWEDKDADEPEVKA